MSDDRVYRPNTFQTPNLHVDRAMQYLSGNEYKLLNFAVRHIYGWEKENRANCATISLSMFERGYTLSTGYECCGVGMSRQSIINNLKPLVEFGLLVTVGEATADGQQYGIGETPDWKAIENRHQQKAKKSKRQMEKARSARSPKKAEKTLRSNEQTGAVGFTNTGVVEQTEGGLVNKTQTNTTNTTNTGAPAREPEKPDESTPAKASPPKRSKPAKKQKPSQEQPQFSPLEKAWRDEMDMLPSGKMSKTDIDRLNELANAGVTPDQLKAFVQERFPDMHAKGMSPGLNYVISNIMAWRKSYKPPVVMKLKPIDDMQAWEAEQDAKEAERQREFEKVMEQARLAATA